MSDVYVGALVSEPHLYHHGILGMRWGVRRFQNKDGTLTSRGKTRYNKARASSGDKPEKERKGLSDRQKKMIKVGATLVVAGLVAYGGYKLAQSGKLDGFVNKGKRSLSKTVGRTPGDSGSVVLIDETTGFKKLGKSITSEERRSMANVDHFQDNCKDASFAYCESKIHDIDVTARSKSFKGNLRDFVGHYCEGDPDNTVRTLSADGTNAEARLTKQLLKRYKNGDVGIVSFDFAEKYRLPGAKESGHAFNWEIQDNKVKFIDSQGDVNGNPRDPSRWFRAIDPSKDMEYVNARDLKPKKELLSNSMRNRS